MGADLGIGAGVSGLHFDVFSAFETLSFGHGGGWWAVVVGAREKFRQC